MSGASRTVADALVELLTCCGIRTVFGIPGVHNLELYRALARSEMRHVLARHEQSAGFMADGYARASGEPAACFVISGPGVTNVATAVGQAFSDSVPMLIVATVLDRADLELGRGRLHEIRRQRQVMEPLCGTAATIHDPSAVPEWIGRARAGFRSGRPRPAYVELPLDLIGAPLAEAWTAIDPPAPPQPRRGDLEHAERLLRKAQSPAIIVGGGAVAAAGRIVELAERLGAPVATTVAAKGVMPQRHPLHLGACLATRTGRAFLARRDALLVLGSELAETDLWAGRLSISGELIRVDLDPAVLADGRHPARLAIRGDAAAFAEQLAGRLPPGGTGQDITAVREEALLEAAAESAVRHRVLEAIRRATPGTTLFTSDMTQIAYMGNTVFPVPEPRQWHHPLGFGTLGWAVPAAIGAALGRPGTPVVALVGDYGIQYTLAELATLVELALPVTVVLWDNRGLGQIREEMEAKGMAAQACAPRNPDFLRLAEAMGLPARQPASLEELEESLARAVGSGGPFLLHVREDRM